MAFNMKHDDSAELQDSNEINVTPFIDVMLVLLIIFMVAAPLATVSVPVDLPSSKVNPQPVTQDPLYLTLQPSRMLTLGEDQTVAYDQLGQALKTHLGEDKEKRINLRADRQIPYGEIMEVMGIISTAGYQKVALVGLEGVR